MTASPHNVSAAAGPPPQLQHDGRRLAKKQDRQATATDASRGKRKQSTAERFSSTIEFSSGAGTEDFMPRQTVMPAPSAATRAASRRFAPNMKGQTGHHPRGA